MPEKLAKIDLKEEFNTIDINNISWDNYSDIMISLECMLLLLNKGYNPEYSKSHRALLIKKYELLFNNLKKGYPKYRSQTETLDDIEILKALNYIKI